MILLLQLDRLHRESTALNQDNAFLYFFEWEFLVKTITRVIFHSPTRQVNPSTLPFRSRLTLNRCSVCDNATRLSRPTSILAAFHRSIVLCIAASSTTHKSSRVLEPSRNTICTGSPISMITSTNRSRNCSINKLLLSVFRKHSLTTVGNALRYVSNSGSNWRCVSIDNGGKPCATVESYVVGSVTMSTSLCAGAARTVTSNDSLQSTLNGVSSFVARSFSTECDVNQNE